MTHQARAPKLSQVEMTEILLPQHTNSLGTAFGGVILSWIDVAAAICSQRHCQETVVTASVDAMHFLAPIRLGWVVNIKASVNFASKHSCEVGVKVSSENPKTGETYHTASAYLTMVALDDDGNPTLIPEVLPESNTEKRRLDEAKLRREHRLKMRDKIKEKRKNDQTSTN